MLHIICILERFESASRLLKDFLWNEIIFDLEMVSVLIGF